MACRVVFIDRIIVRVGIAVEFNRIACVVGQRVAGQETPCTWSIIPRPQGIQAGCDVELLAGVAVGVERRARAAARRPPRIVGVAVGDVAARVGQAAHTLLSIVQHIALRAAPLLRHYLAIAQRVGRARRPALSRYITVSRLLIPQIACAGAADLLADAPPISIVSVAQG